MGILSTYLKKSKAIILAFLFMFMALSTAAYASENSTIELPAGENIKADKVWRIKFSKKLKRESVNNVNIKVEKTVGNKLTILYPKVVLSNDGQTVLVNAPTEGYTPRANYYVTVTQEVKAEDGSSLKGEVKRNILLKIRLLMSQIMKIYLKLKN